VYPVSEPFVLRNAGVERGEGGLMTALFVGDDAERLVGAADSGPVPDPLEDREHLAKVPFRVRVPLVLFGEPASRLVAVPE
jgi:hypothetical protein